MNECKPLASGEPGGPIQRHHEEAEPGQGKEVQVDPMEPTLKPPGTERLKLNHDEPPSNFAFKFNLRRYAKNVICGKCEGRVVQVDSFKPRVESAYGFSA